jgi:molybdopterin-containing oxidoreductase family iron-sulfur binding subunit
LEIVFRLDPNIHDGRFANNGWLQELPRQVTKITWDNAALMSPATAEKLGVGFKEGDRGGSHGQAITDVLELEYAGQKLRMPAWVVPGHADGAVTVHLGFGRTHAGEVGTAVGVNTYALWTSDAPFFGTGLRVRKTQETFILACTMAHQPMDLSRVAKERGIFLASTIDEFRNDPSFLKKAEAEHKKNERIPLTMYPDHQYPESRWGMSIDLGSCVGCGACVIACQAENNIPVVGKTEVTQGREMHWLRIDRYFEGEEANPQAVFQPVPCMHCENAPCELVCPVEATVHGNDGLNEMIYNRCVGTRYCSNNCPYKVRRFNFLQYADYATESLKLMRNPDVTVRSRGVMEKCTYCVQRIREAEINAKNQHRGIRDGDVVTACMAACPAEAIIFGNVNDKTSRVSRLKGSPLDFGMLADLNTRPQTTYLAALRNPNPDPALTTGK